MGDYPVQTAKLLNNGEELGKKSIDKFGGLVPYLPKVLSIAKPLPLQIHPNKQLREKMHKEIRSNLQIPITSRKLPSLWGRLKRLPVSRRLRTPRQY